MSMMANEKWLIDANEMKNNIIEAMMRQFEKNGDQIALRLAEMMCHFIDVTDTVDAVEVVHGRWEPHFETFDADQAVGILGGNYQTGWQCSVCGRYEPSKEPYCNCGAKMDGDFK